MCKLIIYKSNTLIEASYKLTLQEQRILLMCIAKLNPRDEIPQKTFQLTANEFYQAFPDVNHKNAERHLQEAINRLWDRTITIHWKTRKKEDIRWIQRKALYFDGKGKIEISFSDYIIPYLTQLRGQFTQIAVKNISALKRTYSIRIYELLQQFKKTEERMIDINDFRSMLDLEDKYKEFRTLNDAVIKPCIKELNEKSNLIVTAKTVKQKRTVIALCFSFKEKKRTT